METRILLTVNPTTSFVMVIAFYKKIQTLENTEIKGRSGFFYEHTWKGCYIVVSTLLSNALID